MLWRVPVSGARTSEFVNVVGDSPAAVLLQQQIAKAARTSAKVLITGESGAGKEVVARAIHESSPRAAAAFAAVNCAGVPETLLESELFGHAKGSYTGAYRDEPGTFEAAHLGTVFLDEIGETTPRMQTLLLRFLESGELQTVGVHGARRHVDVRVIAATNRNLPSLIATGAFREDVYYRLNVINIVVPPLRERLGDIPVLAKHFLQRFAPLENPMVTGFADGVIDAFRSYGWPGNIRELQNIIERMVVNADDPLLTTADLPLEVLRGPVAGANPQASGTANEASGLYARMLEQHEPFWTVVYRPFIERDITKRTVREVVRRGLAASGGNYRAVARLFNLAPRDYKRFHNFLRQHDCHVPFRDFR